MREKYAIILDGDQKSALATARSLGAQGIKVVAGAEHATAMTLHSKNVLKIFTYPSPLKNPDEFIDCVMRECSALSLKEKPVLFAMSDASSLLLLRNYKKIENVAKMMIPSEEGREVAFNKAKTVNLAQKLDIKTPKTYMPTSEGELDGIQKKLKFPLVVKPRHTSTWFEGKGFKGTVVFAYSAEDLLEQFVYIKKGSGETPIIQECIRGDEFGVEVLSVEGEIRALSAHKRIRSISPLGGASVVKETISPSKDMEAKAVKIIKELSWSGVAMIEFKENRKTGDILLIEINGRFWGSLPLAIMSGVDFPNLYFEISVSGKTESSTVVRGKKGIKSRYLLGDVKNLLLVLFSGDKEKRFGYPTRAKAVYNFFKIESGVKYDVISLRDPVPFFMDILYHLLH